MSPYSLIPVVSALFYASYLNGMGFEMPVDCAHAIKAESQDSDEKKLQISVWILSKIHGFSTVYSPY